MKNRFMWILLTGVMIASISTGIGFYCNRNEEEVIAELPDIPTALTIDEITYVLPMTMHEFLDHGWEYDSSQEYLEQEYVRLVNEKGSEIEVTLVKQSDKESDLEVVSGILVNKENFTGTLENDYGISFGQTYEELTRSLEKLGITYDLEEQDNENIVHYYFGVSGSGQVILMNEEIQSVYVQDILPYLDIEEV